MLSEEVPVGLRSLDVNEEDAAAGFWMLLDAVVLVQDDWLFFTNFSSEVCLAVDWEMNTQSRHALLKKEPNPNIDL